jgi:inorganic pyrophosphatase
MKLLRKLKPFDPESGNLNVVIDTPKGCRNKYAFDFDINAYKLKTVLPKGAVFPFDFGSIQVRWPTMAILSTCCC